MIKKITKIIKNNKGFLLLSVGLIFGLFLLLPSNKNDKTIQKENTNEEKIETFTQKTEVRLEALINGISGVSGAQVMIMLKSGSEYVYASDDSLNAEKHVIVEDGLVYVKEYLPEIEGVAVVCNGGDDPIIKAKVTELVCSLLGLYSTHVYITQ